LELRAHCFEREAVLGLHVDARMRIGGAFVEFLRRLRLL